MNEREDPSRRERRQQFFNRVRNARFRGNVVDIVVEGKTVKYRAPNKSLDEVIRKEIGPDQSADTDENN